MNINDYFSTADLTNPYYVGPQDGYKRFDYEKFGEGVKHDINPYLAFDKKFGSQLIPRAEIQGLSKQHEALLSGWAGGAGGLGGAAINQTYKNYPTTKENEAAAKFNSKLDKYSLSKYTYDGLDKFYKDAFKAYGISEKDISSIDAINSISPEKKLAVENHVAAMKQAQNQVPKSGILDSVPGKIALALAGAINPYAAAGLGAFAGGLSGEGGLLNAFSGALKGYGYGNIINNGVNIGGKQLLDPIVYKGTPNGVNLLDLARETPIGLAGTAGTHGGNVAPFFEPTNGTIVNGEWFNVGKLPHPDTGPVTNKGKFSIPNPDDYKIDKKPKDSQQGINIHVPGIALPNGGVIQDGDQENKSTFIPPLSGFANPGPSNPGALDQLLPSNMQINQNGLIDFGASYKPPPLPSDILASNYFDINTNPFDRPLLGGFFMG